MKNISKLAVAGLGVLALASIDRTDGPRGL